MLVPRYWWHVAINLARLPATGVQLSPPSPKYAPFLHCCDAADPHYALWCFMGQELDALTLGPTALFSSSSSHMQFPLHFLISYSAHPHHMSGPAPHCFVGPP